jgi:FlaG/FlaF family flagellin (archaellin)
VVDATSATPQPEISILRTSSTQMVPLVEVRWMSSSNFAADEAEVAVDVADPDAEHEARELVVEPADDDAVPGVVAFELEAVDEADAGAS